MLLAMLRYIPSLDVLRAIAVLLVVFVHVPVQLLPPDVQVFRAYLRPGYLGVDIFFALSGFLITRILIAERGEPRAWRRFWVRRVLRIFPIYYLLLAIVALVRPGPELAWVATYTSNFYFVSDALVSPLQHTWSLAVEEHFYLVWPFVVLLASPRAAKALILVLFVPAAIATAVWLVKSGTPEAHLVVGHITPTRILTLSLGSLLAFGEGFLGRHRLATGLLGAALVPLGYGMAYWGFKLPGLRPLVVVWLLIGGALLSVGATLLTIQLDALRMPRRLAPVLGPALAGMRAVGRVSYGLYLYHFPIFFALKGRMLGAEGSARYGWLVAALVLSFAAAFASYHLIERPILRKAARFRTTEQRPV